MKIQGDNNQLIQEYKSHGTSRGIGAYVSQMQGAGALLDINNIKNEVNTFGDVYESHGRTMQDVAAAASNTDVTASRNAMVVMTNTMSEKDYKRAAEEGFDPSSMTPEESVTIMDHIKVALAQSGEVIAGYNDDLNEDVVQEISGSSTNYKEEIRKGLEKSDLPATEENIAAIKKAEDMLDNIKELPEGSVKYMVEQDMRPTLENIYTARYSATGDGNAQARGFYAQQSGYMAKKADIVDEEAVREQVERSIGEMNTDMDSEEAVELGMWLVEKGVPLTEDKLVLLKDIKDIPFPINKTRIMDAALHAMGRGRQPWKGELKEHRSSLKAAEDILKAVEGTIVREESRLRMTVACAARMADKGITVDTVPIEKLVEGLRQEEQRLKEQLFGSGTMEEINQKADIFFDTIDTLDDIPSLPAAVLGRQITIESAAGIHREISLGSIHREGSSLRADYIKAEESYEALMTAPRRDMGDSITKAFRNVDDILNELSLPLNEANRKAVRILGYNSMEINQEAIDKVRELDSKVMNLVENLKPGKVLSLIREGINPLEESVDSLTARLEKEETEPGRHNENFARFLQKLDSTKEITAEERAAYIGVYRMLHKLEKTDYAAIGTILESNSGLTFGNLLTAIKSKGKNVNIKIDDDFGFLTEKVEKGISITAQIEAAFDKKLGEEKEKQVEESIQKENYNRLKEITASVEEAEIEELVNRGQRVTPDNIEAYRELTTQSGELFRKLRAFSRRADRAEAIAADGKEGDTTTDKNQVVSSNDGLEQALNRASANFIQAMKDRESAAEGYKRLMDVCTNTLETMTDSVAESVIDLKSISLMHKQLALTSGLSLSEDYHVPVTVNGRLTDINVRLVHGQDKGRIEIRMETEELGRVSGELALRNGTLEGILFTEGSDNRDDSISMLEKIGKGFANALSAEGYDSTIRYAGGHISRSRDKNIKFADENADNKDINVESNQTDTAGLYRIARLFIDAAGSIDF